jgi:Holliday junction resolvase RusA-like endonuclease
MPRPKAHYDTKGHVKKRFKHAAHTPRPDLDKLTRAVFDALTIAGIVEDDSHITSAVIAKRYADSPENTGVCITVEA